MNNKFITVVIPAYNEGDLIYKTVSSVKKAHLVNQVIVIDDGSVDNTPLEAKRAGAELIRLSQNKGKGNALNVGFLEAKENIIAFLDGDLGESVRGLSVLATPVINDEVDISIAKFNKGNNSRGFGFFRLFGSVIIFLLTGKYISSPLSGQRVMTKKAAKTIFPSVSDFGVEIDSTIKAIKNKLSIKEVEVEMKHRITERNITGLKHRISQGYQIIKTIILNHMIKRTKKDVFHKRCN